MFAPDRPGLLYDITHVLHREGASIVLARITTEGGHGVDAFYLVNAVTGAALSETERERIGAALRAALVS